MGCLISTSIADGIRKGKSLKVIKRYLQLKYKLRISDDVWNARVKSVIPAH